MHWLLGRSAVDLGEPGRDYESGFGLIDVAEAVRLARETKDRWNNRLAARRIRTVTNDWSNFDGFLELNSLGRTRLAAMGRGFVVIPKPGTAPLILAVLAAVALRRRRR